MLIHNNMLPTLCLQWSCTTADVPAGLRLVVIDVSCEDYGYDGDSRVLLGSCALHYEIRRTEGSFLFHIP